MRAEHFHGDELVATHRHRWKGYAAADVVAAKTTIWKGNHSPYTREGNVLKRYCADGRWHRLTIKVHLASGKRFPNSP